MFNSGPSSCWDVANALTQRQQKWPSTMTATIVQCSLKIRPSSVSFAKGNMAINSPRTLLSLLYAWVPLISYDKPPPPAPTHLIQGQEHFEIDRIVASKIDNNGHWYKVRWQGKPASEDSWEPHDTLLQDCPYLVRSYEKYQRTARRRQD